MRRRSDPELNFWPAVADVFLGFCIIALLLWFLQNLQAAVRAAAEDKVVITEALKSAPDRAPALKDRIESLEQERDILRNEITKMQRLLNEKPPVINIASSEVRFPSGSAELSATDQATLEEKKFPMILDELRKFGSRVDTIEIVGHTDGQPLSSPSSNVDRLLVDVLNGQAPASSLRPGSNTDLGLMRALAVRAVLRPWLDKNGHPQIQIRCYSAGSGVRPDGSPARLEDKVDKADHRRIEILFLGLGSSTKQTAPDFHL